METAEGHGPLGTYLATYLWMETRLNNILTLYLGHEDAPNEAIISLVFDASMPSRLKVLRKLLVAEGWGDLGDVAKLVDQASKDRNLVSHSPQVTTSTIDRLVVMKFGGRSPSGLRELSVDEIMARVAEADRALMAVFQRVVERRGLMVPDG